MKTNERFLDLTDEELVEHIVNEKNTVMFGVLYDRYERKVYNKCYGFAKSGDGAADLTQDVFLKLFTKLHSFNGHSKFSTWLYSFTYNFCANYVKRNKEFRISKESDLISENESQLLIEVSDESLFQMRVDKLQKALELIPPEDKSILLLKYQDDVSIKELEVLLNLGESAVKMRLKRAKARIIKVYNTI